MREYKGTSNKKGRRKKKKAKGITGMRLLLILNFIKYLWSTIIYVMEKV